ncbi:P36 [Xanthomonas phage phiL7]|uniref:p36 n=1 Tax=Xanthomonas phage phiL7 TaxID=538979 RepID=C4ML36_9CAUD|nr:P36 [Xanthomonas phage phiL7]ACE75776.1 P36 [Xanthomonas phage phiL7]
MSAFKIGATVRIKNTCSLDNEAGARDGMTGTVVGEYSMCGEKHGWFVKLPGVNTSYTLNEGGNLVFWDDQLELVQREETKARLKVGDKVRRINLNWPGMSVGEVGVVSERGTWTARVVGVGGLMAINNLELVESAPADKEADLRAAYVQAVKDHEEAVVTLDKLRTEVWQTEDKAAQLDARKRKAHSEFTAYILQKELPQAEQP